MESNISTYSQFDDDENSNLSRATLMDSHDSFSSTAVVSNLITFEQFNKTDISLYDDDEQFND